MESPPTTCFLCDQETHSSETRMLTSTMPHSKATPLLKIEQLLQEHCMILVGQEDELCECCHNLLIELDKLEVAIRGFLTIKFNLGIFKCLSDDVESADLLSVEEYSTDVIINDEPLESAHFDLVSSHTNQFSENIPTYQRQNSLPWSLLVPEQLPVESNGVRTHESLEHVADALEQESLKHGMEPLQQESVENVVAAIGHLEKTPTRCIKSRQPQQCPKCASVLSTKFGLDKHMKLHNSVAVKCELCDSVFPDSLLCRQHVHKVHMQHTLQQGRPAIRNILSKSRTKSTKVCKQVRKQARTRQFKCTKCEWVFKDTSSLENHLRRHKSAPGECNICDAVLPDSLLLRQHKRLVHDGLKNPAASKQHNGPYPCPVCTRLLKSKKTLQRHLTCHNTGSVKCGACDEILPDKTFLPKHTEEVHRLISKDQPADLEQDSTVQSPFVPEGAIQVTQPATTTKSNGQRENAVKKPKRKYKCPKCPVVLTQPFSLRRHVASHNSRPFTCQICKSVLADRLLLQQHTHEMHLQGVQPVLSTDSESGQATASPAFLRYKCPKCACVLAHRTSLKGHLSRHDSRPAKCKLCLETLPDNLTLRQHMLKVHQQVLKGSWTKREKELAARTLLEMKSDSVSDEELSAYMKRASKWPYKCSKCAYTCADSKYLSRHMDLHKTASIVCKRWLKMLPDEVLLQHHMQMVHLQDFQCAECRAVLPSKWMLVRHLAAHKPEDHSLRGHLCSVCGKELRSAYGLRSHERRHEGDSGLVGCAECPERFLDRLLLRRHEVQAHGKVMKVQPSRRCVQCNLGFRDSYRLKRHKDLVHGPRTLGSVACREHQPTT